MNLLAPRQDKIAFLPGTDTGTDTGSNTGSSTGNNTDGPVGGEDLQAAGGDEAAGGVIDSDDVPCYGSSASSTYVTAGEHRAVSIITTENSRFDNCDGDGYSTVLAASDDGRVEHTSQHQQSLSSCEVVIDPSADANNDNAIDSPPSLSYPIDRFPIVEKQHRHVYQSEEQYHEYTVHDQHPRTELSYHQADTTSTLNNTGTHVPHYHPR
eukprot:Lankesteria_metandrocarpae@DN4686_c1_g2_i1.p1